MFVIVIWSQYRPQWGMWQQFSVYLCATAETHDNLKRILCTPILQSAPSPCSFLHYVPYFLHSRVSIEGNATERVNWLGRWQWWGQQQYIYLDQLLIQGSHQLECSEISLVIFQSKSTPGTQHSPITVGSRSTKTALGTCFPAPVSLKNVLKESSPPPMVLSLGICPSGWIPCSKQYSSQQALPICTPAWPTWIEMHSRWGEKRQIHHWGGSYNSQFQGMVGTPISGLELYSGRLQEKMKCPQPGLPGCDR